MAGNIERRYVDDVVKGLLRLMPLLIVMTVGIYACVRFGTGEEEQKREKAKVGDCLSGSSANEVKVVDCDDPAVRWRVVGVADDIDSAKYKQACDNVPQTDTVFFETTYTTDVGYVLCLRPAKPTPGKNR